MVANIKEEVVSKVTDTASFSYFMKRDPDFL